MKTFAFTFGICGLVLFGSGLLIGREFPRRHYQLLREGSSYLLDTSTGKLCEVVLSPPLAGQENEEDASAKYFNQLTGHKKTKSPVCDPE